jgi:hypothetical protein
VTPPKSDERTTGVGTTAHDRFEGEHPSGVWPRGRDAQALLTGYAPSKYRTKPWPTEALLEAWYSLSREVLSGFTFDAPSLSWPSDPRVAGHPHQRPALRSRLQRTAVTESANQPPGVEGEGVGAQDGYALDTAFPRSANRGAP